MSMGGAIGALGQQAAAHPYDALWAQLSDLTGALGAPLCLAHTVVLGQRRALVARFLHVLSYFVRCNEVFEITLALADPPALRDPTPVAVAVAAAPAAAPVTAPPAVPIPSAAAVGAAMLAAGAGAGTSPRTGRTHSRRSSVDSFFSLGSAGPGGAFGGGGVSLFGDDDDGGNGEGDGDDNDGDAVSQLLDASFFRRPSALARSPPATPRARMPPAPPALGDGSPVASPGTARLDTSNTSSAATVVAGNLSRLLVSRDGGPGSAPGPGAGVGAAADATQFAEFGLRGVAATHVLPDMRAPGMCDGVHPHHPHHPNSLFAKSLGRSLLAGSSPPILVWAGQGLTQLTPRRQGLTRTLCRGARFKASPHWTFRARWYGGSVGVAGRCFVKAYGAVCARSL